MSEIQYPGLPFIKRLGNPPDKEIVTGYYHAIKEYDPAYARVVDFVEYTHNQLVHMANRKIAQTLSDGRVYQVQIKKPEHFPDVRLFQLQFSILLVNWWESEAGELVVDSSNVKTLIEEQKMPSRIHREHIDEATGKIKWFQFEYVPLFLGPMVWRNTTPK